MGLDKWKSNSQLHEHAHAEMVAKKKNPRIGQWAIEASVDSRVVLTESNECLTRLVDVIKILQIS